MFTAYRTKTKEKNIPIVNASISKTAVAGGKTRYIVKGDDGQGNKLSVITTEAKALEAIDKGIATKAW